MEVAGEVRLSMVIIQRWAGCYGVPQLHSDSSESPLRCRGRRELWRALRIPDACTHMQSTGVNRLMDLQSAACRDERISEHLNATAERLAAC